MQVLQVVDHRGVAGYAVLDEQVGLKLLAGQDDCPFAGAHDVQEIWVLGGGVGKGHAANVAKKKVEFAIRQKLD